MYRPTLLFYACRACVMQFHAYHVAVGTLRAPRLAVNGYILVSKNPENTNCWAWAERVGGWHRILYGYLKCICHVLIDVRRREREISAGTTSSRGLWLASQRPCPTRLKNASRSMTGIGVPKNPGCARTKTSSKHRFLLLVRSGARESSPRSTW